MIGDHFYFVVWCSRILSITAHRSHSTLSRDLNKDLETSFPFVSSHIRCMRTTGLCLLFSYRRVPVLLLAIYGMPKEHALIFMRYSLYCTVRLSYSSKRSSKLNEQFLAERRNWFCEGNEENFRMFYLCDHPSYLSNEVVSPIINLSNHWCLGLAKKTLKTKHKQMLWNTLWKPFCFLSRILPQRYLQSTFFCCCKYVCFLLFAVN